jgi:hypothetical protein
VLTVSGLGYESVASIERQAVACGALRRVVLLWQRPLSDGRSGATPNPSRIDVDEKEVVEMATELTLARIAASPRQVFTAPPAPASTPLGAGAVLTRFSGRTLYDPDWFAITVTAHPIEVLLDAVGRRVVFPPGFHAAAFDDGLKGEVTTGMSKSAKRRAQVVGDLRRPRFGYVTEESSSFTTFAATTAAAASETHCVVVEVAEGETVFVHYPWVRDNVYHTHNDNILPLLLAAEELGVVDPRKRQLIVLPTARSQRPLPVFDYLADHLFANVTRMNNRNGPAACVRLRLARGSRFVWGRPARFFAAEARVAARYFHAGVVTRLRTLLLDTGAATCANVASRFWEGAADSGADQPNTAARIRVLWLQRGEKRRLRNEKVLLLRLLSLGTSVTRGRAIELQRCCEGLTYADQVALAGSADVVLGVHGAGLLHILHMGLQGCRDASLPPPVVFHIGSRRMNYHEQTIIERLALAVSPPVVYRSTRTRTEADDTTTWQEAFSIPDEEAAAIANDAIATYVAGFDE